MKRASMQVDVVSAKNVSPSSASLDAKHRTWIVLTSSQMEKMKGVMLAHLGHSALSARNLRGVDKHLLEPYKCLNIER
jgi:hypothetical protein